MTITEPVRVQIRAPMVADSRTPGHRPEAGSGGGRAAGAAGLHSLRVKVVPINPNRPFYERLGGQYLGNEPLDWNGVMVSEAVYGWRDTAPLIAEDHEGVMEERG